MQRVSPKLQDIYELLDTLGKRKCCVVFRVMCTVSKGHRVGRGRGWR